MAIKSEYESREVEAAQRVLIDLMQILGEYREGMVLIGGWVPYYHFGKDHIGSMDIDIALDKDKITGEVYNTIREHLQKHRYQEGKQPFIFLKDITIDTGEPITVEVDFLAGEYDGTDPKHRHQEIQPDLKARKARGSELALKYCTRMVTKGTTPDGSANTVEFKLSNVLPFIVMKGMALYDRDKEKDAWDIYFCVKHFKGGVKELAKQFRTILDNGLVQEGLAKIRFKFVSIDDFGPSSVVAFEALQDRTEQEQLRRDAFEQVSTMLDALEIKPYLPKAKGAFDSDC